MISKTLTKSQSINKELETKDYLSRQPRKIWLWDVKGARAKLMVWRGRIWFMDDNCLAISFDEWFNLLPIETKRKIIFDIDFYQTYTSES